MQEFEKFSACEFCDGQSLVLTTAGPWQPFVFAINSIAFFLIHGAMTMKITTCGLVIILLVVTLPQCVNAQMPGGDNTSFAIFRDSEFETEHIGGIVGPPYPNLNEDDGVFATGMDGLVFRQPIRTEHYKRNDEGIYEATLYTDVLYEVTVRDAADKMVLSPGEQVTIDFEVTLLDSYWAPKEFYCEWNWEDDEDPIVFELDDDFVQPGSNEFDWFKGDIQLKNFTEISRVVKFCDFDIRNNKGIGKLFRGGRDALVLPCASYKGTLVVEFNGNCNAEKSITFFNSPYLTVGHSSVKLNWEQKRQFLSAATFYNNSSYDVLDDADAIAPDKVPFFNGETAEFDNYTSYGKGLNGIVIDIRNQSCHPDMAQNDFVFKMGIDNTPVDWELAPAPEIYTDIGAGVDGTDRIWLIWDDNAIKKTWLQVQIPGVETESGQETTFYFGNVPGETGNANDTRVNVFDLLNLRKTWGQLADLESKTDFDRSGQVNVFDLLILRKNYNRLPIPLITPQAN